MRISNAVEQSSLLELFVVLFLAVVSLSFCLVAGNLLWFHKHLPPEAILPNRSSFSRPAVPPPVVTPPPVETLKPLEEKLNFLDRDFHKLHDLVHKMVLKNLTGLDEMVQALRNKPSGSWTAVENQIHDIWTLIELIQKKQLSYATDNSALKKSVETLSDQVLYYNELENFIRALLEHLPSEKRIHEIVVNTIRSMNFDKSPYPTTTTESVRNTIMMDLVGLPDRASALGSIESTDYVPTEKNPRTIGNLFIPDKQLLKYSPADIIKQRSPVLARCWPFKGSSASIVIKLSCPVQIQNVTLDHMLREFCLNPESAPKNLLVLGKASQDPRGDTQVPALLANVTFGSELGIQTFAVNNPDLKFYDTVEVKFLENYGHWYTCVYRFRIHGDVDQHCLKSISS